MKPPNPLNNLVVRRQVASRRRQQREALGLDVRQVAAKLGISHETLVDWESAAYWPLPEVSERWRNVLRPGSRHARKDRHD